MKSWSICCWLLSIVGTALVGPSLSLGDDVIYLDQGLKDAERQDYYYRPQGSEVLPYRWFLALEQAHSQKLFRDDDFLESYGFLRNPINKSNPDGFPVGFANGRAADGTIWTGLTCAACHTAQLHSKEKRIRIDGGPNLVDLTGWQQALTDALRTTVAQPPKFERFAKQVLADRYSEKSAGELKTQLSQYAIAMTDWAARNRSANPTGPGCFDALNTLMNATNATSAGNKDNFRVPNMPVSYPAIWLTQQEDRVLWNGAVHNMSMRRVGEVIGVFGRAKVTPTASGLKFETTADMKELDKMYDTLMVLQPPKWPESIFGAIDRAKADQGAKIFERESCAQCHSNRPPYPQTEPNKYGKQFIKVSLVPFQEVGTDPTYAVYFVERTASTGILGPMFKGTAYEGKSEVPAAVMFLGLLANFTMSGLQALNPTPDELVSMLGYREMPTLPKNDAEVNELVKSLLVYRAAPLAGIWATAPYLHNGSIANLNDLLLPPEKRAKSFYTGNRQFDPARVGYQTAPAEGSTKFDTTVPGQSNMGHLYGTKITDDERAALLEYLKTL